MNKSTETQVNIWSQKKKLLSTRKADSNNNNQIRKKCFRYWTQLRITRLPFTSNGYFNDAHHTIGLKANVCVCMFGSTFTHEQKRSHV